MRLYTGPAYQPMNAALRGQDITPWATTIACCFSAVIKHLQQCRDTCDAFGGAIRAVPLHPQTEAEPTDAGASIADRREAMLTAEAERRRAPVPAFTFTSRVGPSIVRASPPGDDDVPSPGA